MSVPLVVAIIGDTKQLQAGLADAGKQVSVFGKSIDVGGVAKLAAFGGVATLAVGALVGLADAAAQDAAEAAALETAITAAGGAVGDWQADVEASIAAGQALAFTDTQIRDALTPLVGVLGSVTEAQGSLALAEDIARLKKIDLKTAAEAVAKAEGGQATALAKLIGVSTEGKTATEILALAQQRAAGQAKTYGATTAGAAERNGIAMAELGEKIGGLLLPVLDAFIPAILPVIDALSEIMTAILPIIIPLIEVLGTVLGIAARAIAAVAKAIAGLIGWLADAIGKVGDFLASLGPVKAIAGAIGDIFSGPGMAAGFAGSGPAMMAGPSSSTTFTVYASSADPDGVVRALQRWAGLNGGWPALERTISR